MSTTIASATVKISPDLTDFEAETDAKVRAALASASANVKVGADTRDAEFKLGETDRELDRINGRSVTARVRVDTSDASAAEHDISGLTAAALSLGPALIPTAAAVTAGFGGMAAALGSVSLGAGVVALAFGKIKAAAETELTPAFTELQKTAERGIMPGVEVALKDLVPVFHDVDPLVAHLAGTLGDLAKEAGGALGGSEFKAFIQFLDAEAGPTLTETAKILGNVGEGFIGLIEAFEPVNRQLGAGLVDLSKDFAAFGENAGHNGFESFVDYMEKEGPPVARTLGDIGGAVGHLVTALAPIGSLSLAGIDDLAKAVHAIPTGDLTVIAGGAAALAVSLKTLSAVKGAGSALGLLGEGGPEIAPVLAAGAAVVALGVGLGEAYTHIKPFHTAVDDLGHTLESLAVPALHGLATIAKDDLEPALKTIGTDAIKGLTSDLNGVDSAIKKNRPELVQLGHAFEDVGKFIAKDVLPVLGPVLEQHIRMVGDEFKVAIDVVGDMVKAFDDVAAAVKTTDHAFDAAFKDIDAAVHTGISGAESALHGFESAAPSLLVSAGENIVAGLAHGIESAIGGELGGALKDVTGFISDHFPHSPAKLGPLADNPPEKSGATIVDQIAAGMDSQAAVASAASARTAKAIITGLQSEISTDLSKAQSHLSSLRSDASSVRSGTLSGFQALGDPSQFSAQTSVGQVLSILGKQRQLGSAFEHNLADARHEGLDKTAYSELLAGGAGQNSNIAALLATATKAQIAAFNRDEGALTSQGRSTGSKSATYLYGKQIDAATRVVRDLRSDQEEATHYLKLISEKKSVSTSDIKALRRDLEAIEKAVIDSANANTASLTGMAHTARLKQRVRPAGARG